MMAWVLDASVAAKWFLPAAQETLAAEDLRVLDGYAEGRLRLLAPDLFRRRRISRETAEEAIEALAERRIPTVASSSLLKDAFTIAAAFDRPVHDGTYVALAIVSGAPLVTADERLANALAAHFPVRWLGS
ncbi:MAG: type II toxin-antitoxin system VapC family toxin, partial [Acidobacteriota bacterium]